MKLNRLIIGEGAGRKAVFAPRVEPTPAEKAKLDKVKAAFLVRLQGMDEKQRLAVIKTTAARSDVDPYENALANQLQTVHDIQQRIAAAKAEIEQIDQMPGGYSPSDPHRRGRMLERREALLRQIDTDAVRAITVAVSDLSSARIEAVEHYRHADAARAQEQAFAKLKETLRSEVAQRATEAKAQKQINAEFIARGEKPPFEVEPEDPYKSVEGDK